MTMCTIECYIKHIPMLGTYYLKDSTQRASSRFFFVLKYIISLEYWQLPHIKDWLLLLKIEVDFLKNYNLNTVKVSPFGSFTFAPAPSPSPHFRRLQFLRRLLKWRRRKNWRRCEMLDTERKWNNQKAKLSHNSRCEK